MAYKRGTNGSETLEGTADSDTLMGLGGMDVLIGLDGNDWLDGGASGDTMIGGIGDDHYYVDNALDVVTENANEGNDWVYSKMSNYTLGANVENLVLELSGGASNGTGNDLDNKIYGNAFKNVLTGGGGDDTLNGGFGADTMIGGTGDDTYYVDNALDVVTENADEGTFDTVLSTISYTLGATVENLNLEGNAAINGTGNGLDNWLIGNDGNNILNGGGGDDFINGAAGADTMIGGTGDDNYFVDNALDVVTENADEGSDTVRSTISYTLGATFENLWLEGSAAINGTGNNQDNHIYGNDSSNTLIGGGGDDLLHGGGDADTMIGGFGDDDYNVDNAGDVVTENANQGTDTVFASINYKLGANVENLTLVYNAGAINGTGNGLDNTLWGNYSANILDGRGGADHMSGAGGDDIYKVDNVGDEVAEGINNGIDWVWSEVSFALGANVEHLILFTNSDVDGTGNNLDNNILGTSGKNVLIGAGGNDQLYGFGGDDTIDGGNGDDTIDGGNGLDTIHGGSGNDTINAGNGGGTIQGGDGNDTITAGDGDDSITGGDGDDTIYGGTGHNIMDGHEGDDTITGSGNQNMGFGKEGNDSIFIGGSESALFGGTGEDWLGVSGDFCFLYGEGDNDYLGATGNLNLLDGGAGNDTLEVAAGHMFDRFVFHAGYDQDTIIGFSAASGDNIDLETFGLADFSQLQPYMSQVGSDVVIALNGTDILTLQNVQLNTLNAGHFDLV